MRLHLRHACFSIATVWVHVLVYNMWIHTHILQYVHACADCMFYLPSVPLFLGQGGTSLIPQLWGNLWGSQTEWQCQSPGTSWQPHTSGPVQKTPAWAAWRRHQSLGHFSIQREAHISCLTLQIRKERTHRYTINVAWFQIKGCS